VAYFLAMNTLTAKTKRFEEQVMEHTLKDVKRQKWLTGACIFLNLLFTIFVVILNLRADESDTC